MAAEEIRREFWTTKEIAARCGVTEDCVKHWMTDGLLKRTKLGGATRVSEDDFQDFRRRCNQRAASIPLRSTLHLI